MNEQDDPYETLNLPRSATQAQIKASYRKLALKYHPDKQTNANEETKRKCNEQFAKIGNAYEILGDPERRSEYDRFGTVGAGAAGSRSSHNTGGFRDPFAGGFFGGMGGMGGDPFMNDPFFARHRQQHQQHHQRGGFMDPFELFRNVFGDDLNDSFGGFDDFGHGGGVAGGGGRGNAFGGMMGNMMNSMMNMHSTFGNGGNMNQGNTGGRSSTFSSYSSNSFGGSGGVSESVSTSTRIINGKRQTVTERTIVKPDGTVERTVETSGDDDFPSSLGYGQNAGYLPDSSSQQQQYQGSGNNGFLGSNRGR